MKSIANVLSSTRQRQTGIALITGLIFMVVLTLIAMAAMRTTMLEERMSGNAQDRDSAFQAAEAALRAGEQVLTGATLPAFASGTAYTPKIAQGTLTTYWISTHPWSTQSVAAWQPAGTFAAPRYVIEEVGTQAAGGGLGIGAVASSGVYRITARGVGRSSNTIVILQSVYEQ